MVNPFFNSFYPFHPFHPCESFFVLLWLIIFLIFPAMKKIILNGDEKMVVATSIVALLKELQLPLSTVLVEQNGVALLRHELEKALLHAGDRIEILKVVAGG